LMLQYLILKDVLASGHYLDSPHPDGIIPLIF